MLEKSEGREQGKERQEKEENLNHRNTERNEGER